jgi:hypothetical protein
LTIVDDRRFSIARFGFGKRAVVPLYTRLALVRLVSVAYSMVDTVTPGTTTCTHRPALGAPLPMANANMRALQQTIQRLRLYVVQHVPIHGRVGTHDEFTKIVGQPATN